MPKPGHVVPIRNAVKAVPLRTGRANNNNGGFSGFLKVGVGNFPEILGVGGTHFLRTFMRGAVLSATFDLALASLQAVPISSLFSISCCRARFLKLR